MACPFGISKSPGEYQDRMAHEILQDYYLNGAIVYIDDMVIYGSTVKGFLTILDQTLSRMAAFNFKTVQVLFRNAVHRIFGTYLRRKWG